MGARAPLEIRWSAVAVRHLEEATDYTAQDRRSAAVSIRRRVLKTMALLSSSPFAGKAGRMEGTRETVVPQSSLIVVYQITEDRLEVLGLWHTSRE
jgi:toxin ParE1/3/4